MPITKKDLERTRAQSERNSFEVTITEKVPRVDPGQQLQVIRSEDNKLIVQRISASTE